MWILLTAGIALLASLVLTLVVRSLGPRLGAMDRPKRLSIHTRPTPRIGGLAMLGGFLLAVWYGSRYAASLSIEESTLLHGLLVSGGLICIVGFLGDVGAIPSRVEFALQVIPALVATAFGLQARLVPLIHIAIPLTALYMVGGSCAMNLLDGMDGLAAGVAAITSCFFAVLSLGQQNTLGAVVSLALLGSSLGFLAHNFHRASIFMGDIGSLFLGFVLSSLGVLFSNAPYDVIGFAVPILILGVLVLDTFLAVMRRALWSGSVLSGDRRHIYDLLRSRGIGDKGTLMVMYGLSVTFGVTALLITRLQTWAVPIMIGAEVLFCLLLALRLGTFAPGGRTEVQPLGGQR